MAEVRIVSGADIENAQWDRYVTSHADGSCFHLSAWRQVVATSLKHRLHCCAAVSLEDRSLQGVLPIAEMKSPLFGHAFKSLPGAVEAGVLANNDEIASLLYEHAKEHARSAGADYLELRHRRATAQGWPRNDHLYFGFRRALERTDEAIMLAIPRKQRAEVRKGIAAGCRFEIDETSDRFYRLYADNVHRHGTPGFAKSHFDCIKKAFGDAAEFAVVTDANGSPVSAVLSLYYKDTVFPYYAGDVVRARELSANDFKYYALMTHSAQRGACVFDYGRSKIDTGPYKFKKYWGFEPTPYFYEFALFKRDAIPQTNPSNPKYARIIQAWRSTPRAIVNRIGHPLARHLC